MRLGLRGKLLAVSAALILVIGAVTGLWLEANLHRWLEDRIQTELLQEARLVRAMMEVAPAADSIEGIQPLAKKAGRAVEARVTVIGTDGFLWGDSELDQQGVRAADDHSTRPECLQAAAVGWGTSRRYSDTLKRPMRYVCVPWQRADGVAMVRVALPLEDVEATLGQTRSLVFGAVVAALLVALFLSGLASQLVVRLLDRLLRNLHRHLRTADAGGRGDELRSVFDSVERLGQELERRVAELASERDRFGMVLDRIRVGVVAVDGDGIVLIVNQAAKDLLGLDGDATGRPLKEVSELDVLCELLVGSGAYDEGQLGTGGPSGRSLDVAVTRSTASGGTVAVLHDTTELRTIERIRRDFVANASHELRTPVTVVLSNAETLLDGALDDPPVARRLVEGMHRHGKRLATLLGDLLDLSRIEAGRYPVDILAVAVRDALCDVAEQMSGTAAANGLSLGVEEAGSIEVLADESALSQVLVNLVDNALKYTPKGGEVTLRCLVAAVTVRIEVADDGPGIAPEHHERLFERFFRVDAGRSRSLGGTGLGLAIVKHLAQSMGGSVGMEPNSPQGSVFWLELPLARSRNAEINGG